MAITVVGTAENQAPDGANCTVSLTGLSLQENDVVVVTASLNSISGTSTGVVTSGYTSIYNAAMSASAQLIVALKKMGASPDTSVEVDGNANVNTGLAVVVTAYRGVDPDTPQDAAATSVQNPTAVVPDSPSITTVTNGAFVVSCVGAVGSDTSVTAPSGYSNQVDIDSADVFPPTAGMASKEKATAGAEDPPAWTNWTATPHIAVTVALRPGVTTQTLSPSLYTDADTVYSPSAVRLLSPALFTDGDTVYAPRMGRGLLPALYSDADTFYSPTVARGAVSLSPSLYTDGDTFYAPVVSRGTVTLSPSLYTDGDTFYAPSVYPIESLRPNADVTDGGWTNELDSNVDLFASVDEVAANDDDYIKSGNMPSADIVTLALSDPVSSLGEPFRVRYRYKKLANVAGTIDLTARLMEGATEIAEWVHSDIGGTFIEASQELTALQFAAITDFTALRVQFEATYTA